MPGTRRQWLGSSILIAAAILTPLTAGAQSTGSGSPSTSGGGTGSAGTGTPGSGGTSGTSGSTGSGSSGSGSATGTGAQGTGTAGGAGIGVYRVPGSVMVDPTGTYVVPQVQLGGAATTGSGTPATGPAETSATSR